jgi:hypothetical protein
VLFCPKHCDRIRLARRAAALPRHRPCHIDALLSHAGPLQPHHRAAQRAAQADPRATGARASWTIGRASGYISGAGFGAAACVPSASWTATPPNHARFDGRARTPRHWSIDTAGILYRRATRAVLGRPNRPMVCAWSELDAASVTQRTSRRQAAPITVIGAAPRRPPLSDTT